MRPFAIASASRWLLTGVVVVCVTGMVMPFLTGDSSSFPFMKMASAGFVLVAVACGAVKDSYGRLVLAGLLCCAAGDMLGSKNFVAGLGAFLLAHLVFIAAFAVHGISLRRLTATLPAALLATAALLTWLYPHVPASDRFPVLAYVAVITAMLVTAGSGSEGATGKLILAAAVLFYVSDIFVARWKYVSPGSINGLFCYPLYYSACLSFAWTVFLDLRERGTEIAARR